MTIEHDSAGSLAKRFWAKVRKTDLCWLWIGSTDGRGYGTIAPGRPATSPLKAHRVAYQLLVGPIPEGLILDHLCRNTRCVNPDHLEPVTYAENWERGHHPVTHNQVLSDDEVREIRERRHAGERGSDLARRFGVTQQTICNIVKGRLRQRAGGPLTLTDGRR